ncbi:hypothetical protein YC2023_084121 [Brassica napus]
MSMPNYLLHLQDCFGQVDKGANILEIYRNHCDTDHTCSHDVLLALFGSLLEKLKDLRLASDISFLCVFLQVKMVALYVLFILMGYLGFKVFDILRVSINLQQVTSFSLYESVQ